jgi:hypothetical protein
VGYVRDREDFGIDKGQYWDFEDFCFLYQRNSDLKGGSLAAKRGSAA